ncbi:MAG TPA: outer membrane beta-barrel protein [Candidatus Limnocylindria bacterium]|nr:outer membrane beta-barrel protein [Candidatus Limnocylindria bacterium]
MRRILFLVIFCLSFVVSSASAQGRVEITPFGGTRFGGVIDLTTPNLQNIDSLNIKSTWDYGVLGDFTIFPKFQAEVMWNRQPTQLGAHVFNTNTIASVTDTTLDMYQFSGLYEFGPERAKLKPFVVAGVGFTHIDSNGLLNFENRLAFNVGGGLKYFFSRHVGLRLEARYSPTQTTSTNGVVCDPFFGCFSTKIQNYAQQGQANAGLIFRF